jgi:hypothetical protein
MKTRLATLTQITCFLEQKNDHNIGFKKNSIIEKMPKTVIVTFAPGARPEFLARHHGHRRVQRAAGEFRDRKRRLLAEVKKNFF